MKAQYFPFILPEHNTEVLGSVQLLPTIDTGIQVAEFDADREKVT
jgi:hypothetical protein